jgi:hypothetical protein
MTINNNNIFGAFTLNEARGSRLTGDWLNKESVANYGWFGGGVNPTPAVIATVDRVDFANDSVALLSRGALSVAKTTAATGNSNFGWFGGGGLSPTSFTRTSTVDRIDFSNDSATASVRGPLSLVRDQPSATGNSNYGWFGGGINPTPARISTVDRIDFSNDAAIVSTRGSLSSVRAASGAVSNSNYGWFGGGDTPTTVSTVDRIDFSSDLSATSLRSPLSLARFGVAATGNSNYGWFGGGSATATVDRIDFSNDSVSASPRGPLTLARFRFAATGNSNYGWFGGGFTPTTVSTIDRIDFSNDTGTASLRSSTMPGTGRAQTAATSGVLNIRRQKAGNYGWFAGGGTFPGPTAVSRVQRINFSNDSVTASLRGSLSANTPAGVYGAAATGNSDYGWIIGGQTTSPSSVLSKIDRIDFSNDSPTALSRGSGVPITGHVAVGNANYGWFGSGVDASALGAYLFGYSINYSNDLVAASFVPLAGTDRTNGSSTSNSNYGWFGGGARVSGGYPPLVNITRIDFSISNYTSESFRGTFPAVISHRAATGNSNYGWFGGGSPGPISRVDRINYSNDLVSALARGPLSAAKYRHSATGNANYGWFGGGHSGSPSTTSRTTVDRINFSNDNVSVTVVAGLNTPEISKMAATSNTSR